MVFFKAIQPRMGTVCGTDSEHPKCSVNPCKIKAYSS